MSLGVVEMSFGLDRFFEDEYDMSDEVTAEWVAKYGESLDTLKDDDNMYDLVTNNTLGSSRRVMLRLRPY